MTREEIVDRIWGDAVRRNINIVRGDVVEMVDFVLRKHCPEPQGLDEAPKKRLRKVCNLREDLKDEPIEEKLAELRRIRAEKDRLDEAAEKYRRDSCNATMMPNIDGPMPEYGGSVKDAFKAGAEWMAEQGFVKETQVYADRWTDVDVVNVSLGQGEYGFKAGDKVIVQIRKK